MEERYFHDGCGPPVGDRVRTTWLDCHCTSRNLGRCDLEGTHRSKCAAAHGKTERTRFHDVGKPEGVAGSRAIVHDKARSAPVAAYNQQDAREVHWKVSPVAEDLKKTARTEGLWNMFCPVLARGRRTSWRGADQPRIGGARRRDRPGRLGVGSISVARRRIPAIWKY